jgi:hypothetical protein
LDVDGDDRHAARAELLMAYAQGTKVPVENSRAELEKVLRRYGADAFSYGQDVARAIVAFRAHGRHVKFELALPPVEDFKWGGRLYNSRLTRSAADQRDQRVRELWRALVLVVKAKLEAVESGIEPFDTAFLPYLMLPDGSTAGEWMLPQIERAYELGDMPSLLPGDSSRALPEGTS